VVATALRAPARPRVTHDQRRRNPQHAVAQPVKLPVAAGVRRGALRVIAAVHFHHEPQLRRHEVDDEAVAEHDLPAKGYAELANAQRRPQPRFRFRGSGAVLSGVELKLRCLGMIV
jgi:hypothetical protein